MCVWVCVMCVSLPFEYALSHKFANMVYSPQSKYAFHRAFFPRWRLYIKRNRNTTPICIFSTKVNSDTTPICIFSTKVNSDITQICILCRIPILNVMCYLQHTDESPHLSLQPPILPNNPSTPHPHPYPANHVKQLCIFLY